MEQHLGRKLTRKEVVHHIDGNELNNDLSNLELMSLSKHSKMHMLGHKIEQETREKLRIKSRENRTQAKLTIFDVKNIKRMLRNEINQKLISWIYKVHLATISKINTKTTWSWVN